MIEPRPAFRRFAASVVALAIRRGEPADEITARLYASLANLVGPAGFDVLLARSIVLARPAHPLLTAVATGPGGTVRGLAEAADPVLVEQGTVAIVAYFVELLAVLIGEDLAMGLVRDAWPEVEDTGSVQPEEAKK